MLDIVSNPMVIGTLAVMGTGYVTFIAKDVPLKVCKWVSKRITYTMEVTNEAEVHGWLLSWLGSQAKKSRFVQGCITPSEPGAWVSARRDYAFYLAPLGMCTIRYRGRRILVWIWREPLQHSNGFRETLTFQTLFDGRKLFEHMLADAYAYAQKKGGDLVEVWVPDGSNWKVSDRKPKRRSETLCLTPEAEEIFADAKRFVNERQRYADLGIPYRRGYLLHGPPGNGKSSIALSLASELGVGINVVSLSSIGSDRNLIDCLGNAPRGNILLLEDIDAAWNGRSGQNDLTFSGLLNALDGVTARDGQMVVMTTNHLEKLDAALTRAGRADVKLFIDNATQEQAEAMFRRFHPDESEFIVRSFGENHVGKSMSAIQELLWTARGNLSSLIESE